MTGPTATASRRRDATRRAILAALAAVDANDPVRAGLELAAATSELAIWAGWWR